MLIICDSSHFLQYFSDCSDSCVVQTRQQVEIHLISLVKFLCIDNCCCLASVMSDSVTSWTVAHQAPLSMGSVGENTGVHCHSLLQGFFLTLESNPASESPRKPIITSHFEKNFFVLRPPQATYSEVQIIVLC